MNNCSNCAFGRKEVKRVVTEYIPVSYINDEKAKEEFKNAHSKWVHLFHCAKQGTRELDSFDELKTERCGEFMTIKDRIDEITLIRCTQFFSIVKTDMLDREKRELEAMLPKKKEEEKKECKFWDDQGKCAQGRLF